MDTTCKKIWYLEKFDFLSELTAAQKEFVESQVMMREIRKGKIIYYPEDTTRTIYFLKEGRVKLVTMDSDGNELIIGIMKAGEIFGEQAIAMEGERGELAIAETDCLVCFMKECEMKELMKLNFNLNMKYAELLLKRSKNAEKRLGSVSFKDNTQRIKDFIKEYVIEKGLKSEEGIVVENFLTHDDIANMTATSRQNVTTVLNLLKKQNILNYDRKKIVVLEIEKL